VQERFDQIKNRFQELRADQKSLKNLIVRLKQDQGQLVVRLDKAEKAQIIIKRVALKTQQNLEFHFSDLVTTALLAVTSKWPEFIVQMKESKRSHGECYLLFKEEGDPYHPYKGSGHGPIDVASFALRIAYWCLNKNRPFFLLDEPFRNVSPDLQDKVSDMVTMVSREKKIQILMISHADNINVAADKTFLVTKKNKISTVEVI